MVIEYLNDYRMLLEQIEARATLIETVLNWQEVNRERGTHAQNELNLTFFHGDANPRKLISNHPPTTAVGGLQGLVVIAANPGYDEGRNQEELLFRATAEGNLNTADPFLEPPQR